jgi:hypothetical protein
VVPGTVCVIHHQQHELLLLLGLAGRLQVAVVLRQGPALCHMHLPQRLDGPS